MNKEDPQVLIADLCERFTKIFQEIKEIKETRQNLENENQELTFLINEEIQKHQQSIENLQSELIELQDVKEKESTYFEINPNIEKEINNLMSDIENQQMMISLLEKKKREILEKTDILRKKKNELTELNNNLTQDVEKHEIILENCRMSSQLLSKKNEELENNMIELQHKYDILFKDFNKHEKLYQEGFEEKIRKEDEHKAISNEYRELLKKNSNFAKNLQENEKEINKYSEELKVKIQRLEVLLRLNLKLSSKCLKLEEESLVYEKLLEKNKEMQHNNQILQEKIEILTNNSLNFNYKIQIKKLLNQMNNKTKNLSANLHQLKNIGNFQEKSLVGKIEEGKDDIETIIKQNIYLEEYLKSLENTTVQQNDQIFENKKRIINEEEKLNEMKEAIFSNKIDKDNLEKKFEIMKEKIQKYASKV